MSPSIKWPAFNWEDPFLLEQQLTEEERLVRDTARAYAQEQLAPNAAAWDREAHFPADAVKTMGELGFLGMTVPPDYDGRGRTAFPMRWR